VCVGACARACVYRKQ